MVELNLVIRKDEFDIFFREKNDRELIGNFIKFHYGELRSMDKELNDFFEFKRSTNDFRARGNIGFREETLW